MGLEQGGMARVNLEVPQETKDEWVEAAKNDPNAGGNLSGFIRSAVQAKISESQSESDEGENVHEEIADIKGMVQDLSESLKTTNTRLSDIESETKSDPEREKLANDLFSRLPTKEEFEEWHSGKGEQAKLDFQPEEDRTTLKAERGGKPDAFAKVLDCSSLEIQNAIEYLKANTPLIQETVINGETRIYRER